MCTFSAWSASVASCWSPVTPATATLAGAFHTPRSWSHLAHTAARMADGAMGSPL
ncbi:hypothetical protein [Streptomyces sp. NPDC101206]|uniref:hypothetical protein n=1 Tax=Streptomyces sp. NPDC101206 TaxID=3366128 RepID=UPI00380AAE1E